MTTNEPIAPKSDAPDTTALPDEAVVVRGGLSAPDTLHKTALAHYDTDGFFAISVRSAEGKSVDELASVEPPLPQSKLRATTVGALRATGFDVIPDEPPPAHALIMLDDFAADDDYLKITAVLGAPQENPAYRKEIQ